MTQFNSIIASVASAGAGGKIEVRLNSPNGTLVGTMDVKVNGKWEEWYQVSLEKPIGIANESEPYADLYFVCVHDEKRSGLMNIDWIRFVK